MTYSSPTRSDGDPGPEATAGLAAFGAELFQYLDGFNLQDNFK